MVIDAQERQRLMRVREVAAELDQSVSAIYRKVKSGEITAVRLGNSPRAPLRIPSDELELWLFRQHPDAAAGERRHPPRDGAEQEGTQ